MNARLRDHTPSEAARRRAASEGIDLARLKAEAPIEYMMLNAGEILEAAPELADLAGMMLLAAFPEREVFRAPAGVRERLLAFPPLSSPELKRYERLLAPLVDRPEWAARHAFYREVGDVHGVTRELDLPLAPEAYREGDAVVGPFTDEAGADGWGREQVRPPRVYDCVVMNGHWFCDVFRADEVGGGPGVDTRET